MKDKILAALIIVATLGLGLSLTAQAQDAPTNWGTLKTWPGITTTYAVYEQSFVYGDTPFLIADTRYTDTTRTCYETRSLTVYRAHDGAALRERQPVVFYVHGGGWVSGYKDEYDFVPISFTGEKGWTTVVLSLIHI